MIGRVLEASEHFVHADFLDVSAGVVFDASVYPELFDVLKTSTWSSTTLEQEMNNPAPVLDGRFGGYLAISGDTLVIGAAGNITSAVSSGVIYVYVKVGLSWVLQQEITKPNPLADDTFGSCALDGDTLVVGARNDDTGATNAGSVYVYTRSLGVWTLQQTINNPTPTLDDWFGLNLAISGGTIAIAGHYIDTTVADAGEVSIYENSTGTWLLEQTLTKPTSVASDWFGSGLSLSLDSVIIGAYGDDTNGTNAGAAYVYTRTAGVWSLEQEIFSPIATEFDSFGYRVSIYENTAIIGAYNEDVGASGAGSAFIYTRDAGVWSLEQQLDNPNPAVDDGFGQHVYIYKDIATVGVFRNDVNASNAGSVCVYTRTGTTWSLEQEINNPTATTNGYFGSYVSVSDNNVAVGAYGDDTGAADAGSVYVFAPNQNVDTNTILARNTQNPDTKYFIKAK